ncbi:MAG TPA: phage Gp37/Gp68 family protein [Thermoanaerobaculia bacterium]|nr:phage Gp37/Gp68 family protein [Thermoanaerobaculia bacterium]
MAQATSIEWTEATWNPVTGCTKISPGCKYCYAARMANRLQAMQQPRYRNGFEVTLQEDLIERPLHWNKPQRIFVNSMSDLFHQSVPESFIIKVFETMQRAHWHQFQILTKRADRLVMMKDSLPWPDNVWMGVSVESEKYLPRIAHLVMVPASVRFLSLEPLLGPLPCLPLEGIHWVIVGGESGPGARSMSPQWVRDIRARCLEKGVPFFFKQWGGVRKSRHGRELDGRTWDEMPLTC